MITVSLLISTYNWPEALTLILDSIQSQTILPNEIIIADDGSDKKTLDLVESYRNKLNIPLIHVWQEDTGHRVAEIRNRALAKAKYDYIIQIDGDIILHPKFIADHIHFAKPKTFLRGSRVKLCKEVSEKMLRLSSRNFSYYSKNTISPLNGFRFYPIAKFLSKPKLNPHKVLGCNMSYWRKDAIAVNGYDNTFTGWGHEDEEFTARLVNNSIAKVRLKHYAIAYHIFHQEKEKNNSEKHFLIINNVIMTNKKTALNGIKELQCSPHP